MKSTSAPPRRRLGRWGIVAVLVTAVAVGSAVAVVARPSARKTAAPAAAVPDQMAPGFDEQDVISGQPVSSAGLRGKTTLLFFSEGVMCEACLEQITALQDRSADLAARGLVLVSITTDPPDVLRQVSEAYGITTPMISDENRDMSLAYDVIGAPGAMHSDRPGHTFVLVDGQGVIRWRRDYTRMYVPPDELFAALPELEPTG